MTQEHAASSKALDLDYALALAIRLHQSGEIDDAEELYHTILGHFPACPEALHFLGLLLHQKGDNDRAIQSIERALVIAPNYADAYNNLGNIFNRQKNYEKAAENYRRALDISPENPPALSNLGIVFSQLSRFDEAIEALSSAIALMPDNAEFYRNLGNAFIKQGDFSRAIDAYRRVVSLKPYHAENYENLCVAMCLHGKLEDAVLVVKEWLQHEPENPAALHRLRSYTGEFELPRATDDYITQTFDGFADSFDMVLKRLDYKAPFLVAAEVDALYAECGQAFDMLDAGCGTGLCGPLLKPYAKHLVGVDLSAKMLERAALRGCYDELFQAELTAFIAGYDVGCDLIVSADTLVYFGDLEPVTRAVSDALRPGGHFVFTLERSDDGIAQGYKIHPHGRFSHTERYVRTVIELAGLVLLKQDKVVLRNEAGKPVAGFLVMAGKRNS